MNALADAMADLHERYRPVRPRVTPFPTQSVLTWYLILCLQKDMKVTGDSLEIGVENGGTGFLLAADASESETVYLLDRQKTTEFTRVFDSLSKSVAERISFQHGISQSPDFESLTKGPYRFLHIDGSHRRVDVAADFERFAGSVAEDGIICMDDVFTPRWPGVTEAVFDVVPESDFVPLIFSDRKLYLARKNFAQRYNDVLANFTEELLKLVEGRMWIEPFFGAQTTILSLKPINGFFEAPFHQLSGN